VKQNSQKAVKEVVHGQRPMEKKIFQAPENRGRGEGSEGLKRHEKKTIERGGTETKSKKERKKTHTTHPKTPHLRVRMP